MTVLLVGAIYWVWSQIQYVQRKVNVLENIVYELKTLCSKQTMCMAPDISMHATVADTMSVQYPPAPSSVLGEDEDLLHEQLQSETIFEQPAVTEVDAFQAFDVDMDVDADADVQPAFEPMIDSADQSDLQPGGVGSGLLEMQDSEHSVSALETMTLKQLRRLAEQNGVAGIKDMKRKELIQAIRDHPSPSIFTALQA